MQNHSLDRLAQGHTKLLAFDCEFWHVLHSQGFIEREHYPNEFFLPREIGGMFVLKKKGTWVYHDPFFVTFSKPKSKDVSFVISKYMSATEATKGTIDDLESQLTKEWVRVFHSNSTDDDQRLLKNGLDVYEHDTTIKKAHKPPSWLKIFLKHYSQSLILVKNNADIESLKNMCTLYGIEYVDPLGVFDIATWNKMSYKRCRSAKLYDTYMCIQKWLNSENRQLNKYIPKGKSHDPSVDAGMTLIIAAFIHQS
uniref:Exonuclease domain-containing protein n=1 Tax=viral metagenome TaxID=1070528 RepID=A0A6C0JX04_9ZZZZ